MIFIIKEDHIRRAHPYNSFLVMASYPATGSKKIIGLSHLGIMKLQNALWIKATGRLSIVHLLVICKEADAVLLETTVVVRNSNQFWK